MSLRRNVWSHDLLKERLANYTSNHHRPEGEKLINIKIIQSSRDEHYIYQSGHWETLLTTLAGIVPGVILPRE